MYIFFFYSYRFPWAVIMCYYKFNTNKFFWFDPPLSTQFRDLGVRLAPQGALGLRPEAFGVKKWYF